MWNVSSSFRSPRQLRWAKIIAQLSAAIHRFARHQGCVCVVGRCTRGHRYHRVMHVCLGNFEAAGQRVRLQDSTHVVKGDRARGLVTTLTAAAKQRLSRVSWNFRWRSPT